MTPITRFLLHHNDAAVVDRQYSLSWPNSLLWHIVCITSLGSSIQSRSISYFNLRRLAAVSRSYFGYLFIAQPHRWSASSACAFRPTEVIILQPVMVFLFCFVLK